MKTLYFMTSFVLGLFLFIVVLNWIGEFFGHIISKIIVKKERKKEPKKPTNCRCPTSQMLNPGSSINIKKENNNENGNSRSLQM